MTRTRCGPSSFTSKLKLPLPSALVRPASSIPWPRLSNTTSSPAPGLLVVPFLTPPVRLAAVAALASRNTTQRVIKPVLGEFKFWLLFQRGVAESSEPRPAPSAPFRPARRQLHLPTKFSCSDSQSREPSPPCIRNSSREASRRPLPCVLASTPRAFFPDRYALRRGDRKRRKGRRGGSMRRQ